MASFKLAAVVSTARSWRMSFVQEDGQASAGSDSGNLKEVIFTSATYRSSLGQAVDASACSKRARYLRSVYQTAARESPAGRASFEPHALRGSSSPPEQAGPAGVSQKPCRLTTFRDFDRQLPTSRHGPFVSWWTRHASANLKLAGALPRDANGAGGQGRQESIGVRRKIFSRFRVLLVAGSRLPL